MDLIFHLICTFNLCWNWARGIQLTTSIYCINNSIQFRFSIFSLSSVLFRCPRACVRISYVAITNPVHGSFFALFRCKHIISIWMCIWYVQCYGAVGVAGVVMSKYAMILPILAISLLILCTIDTHCQCRREGNNNSSEKKRREIL